MFDERKEMAKIQMQRKKATAKNSFRERMSTTHLMTAKNFSIKEREIGD